MIELNIYGADKTVEKTYSVDGYDLMFGTAEDFISVIDFDKIDDQNELAKMVVNGFGKLKPLLKDVFPEITEEELKRTKVNEVIRCIIQIASSVAASLSALGNDGKGGNA